MIQKYFKKIYHLNKKIYGIDIFIHWTYFIPTVIVLFFSLKDINVLPLLFTHTFLLLAHELGHGFFARKYDCEVDYIEIGAIHGLCSYRPHSTITPWEISVISWGGIIFQIILGLPFAIYFVIFGNTSFALFNIFILYFFFINLAIIMFNLIPIDPLDGRKAWKIIPIVYSILFSKNTNLSSTNKTKRKLKSSPEKVVQFPKKK